METIKITQKARRGMNAVACKIGRADSVAAAVRLIEKLALEPMGWMLLDEDGTRLEAIFCGESGRTTLLFGDEGYVVDNSVLVLEWHKLSTCYEINAYFS